MSTAWLFLLNEPCAHLNHDAVSWYQHVMVGFGKDRLVVINSNRYPLEYSGINGALQPGQNQPALQ